MTAHRVPLRDVACEQTPPMERASARPRADGELRALSVAPLSRRPAVPGGRLACVHHRVCTGAIGDRGVRCVVGISGLQRVEGRTDRFHLQQLRPRRRALGTELSQPLAGRPGQVHRGRYGGAGGLAADHPAQHRADLQQHLAGRRRAAEGDAFLDLLDGADAGHHAGRRLDGDGSVCVRAAAVPHHRRPMAGRIRLAAGADGGGVRLYRADLPRSAAARGAAAACAAGRAAGGDPDGNRQVGVWLLSR